jgi:hypothetical protein
LGDLLLRFALSFDLLNGAPNALLDGGLLGMWDKARTKLLSIAG